jgi:site-specific recombinase XerD
MNHTEAIARARDVLRRQHKSLATERCYLHWLARYMRALRHMPATLPSEQKMERFLTELATGAGVSASTQNQAFNAILYFYRDVLGVTLANVNALRATRPAHLRHAPTVAETGLLIGAVRDVGGYPVNLIVRLLYGCGLRVTEPLNLRIKDVDMENCRLAIRGAKGGKDRVVALPCSVAEEIRMQMEYARAVWKRDGQARIPLEIPGQLGAKYPEYRFAWPWAWVFPQRHPCKHPRTGELVRYRMHESNVQQGVKEARRKLGIMVLPHELRHAYATHSLNRGVNVKALKEAMGHAQVETTIGYCHAEALSVPSPLEALGK